MCVYTTNATATLCIEKKKQNITIPWVLAGQINKKTHVIPIQKKMFSDVQSSDILDLSKSSQKRVTPLLFEKPKDITVLNAAVLLTWTVNLLLFISI